MRLVITQNITLDGVVEQSERTGDWFDIASGDEDTADLEAALQAMMSVEDAQLYGRKTFEAMRGFWPDQVDDTTGVADHLNRVDKYVISTTLSVVRFSSLLWIKRCPAPEDDDGDVRRSVAAPGDRP